MKNNTSTLNETFLKVDGCGYFSVHISHGLILSLLVIKIQVFLMMYQFLLISWKLEKNQNELKWKKIFLFNPGEEEFLLYKI